MIKNNLNTIKNLALCASLVAVAILSIDKASEAADEAEVSKSEMLATIVTFHVKPGEEEFVEKQMAWFASECMKSEPGTLVYSLIKDEKGLRTMEIYENADAVRAHAESAHHAENVAALSGKVLSIDLERFTVVNHPTR